MKNLRKHFWHYLIYLVIFGGGLTLILVTSGNSNIQAMLILMTAFLYFLWSMVHHYVHHQLQARIVVEYILIMVLGTVLLLFLFGV
jgi:high-affinity Fe2+/Pb2+ permease